MIEPYATGRDWTLYHGDCLEILPQLPAVSVDAVVTDPPYGMNYRRRGNSANSISSTGKVWTEPVTGDDKPFDPSPWLSWPCVFTGAQWFYDRLPAGGVIHTWDKRGQYEPIDQADVDQVWCSIRTPARKFECVWRGLCRHTEVSDPIVHPTQKPIALMAWCVDLVPGTSILDPFTGSGTTGVACLKTGRKFIGIEIDEGYCEVAAKRLRRAEEDTALFAEAEAASA